MIVTWIFYLEIIGSETITSVSEVFASLTVDPIYGTVLLSTDCTSGEGASDDSHENSLFKELHPVGIFTSASFFCLSSSPAINHRYGL